MRTLIRRNTTIPTRTQLFPVFTNAYVYQMTATIRIFEGEHYLTKYNVSNVSQLHYLSFSILEIIGRI
jgi:molecular chaperone DnaK (HSP70)